MIGWAVQHPVLACAFLSLSAGVLSVALDAAHSGWCLWRDEREMRALKRARKVTS